MGAAVHSPGDRRGLADLTGARLLAEVSDETAPASLTLARRSAPGDPGLRSQHLDHPPVKNDRLNTIGFLWAFATIPRPGPTKDHYDRRRAHGDQHAAALRHLFNRMLGQLYHCLQTRQTYDPIKAFGQPPNNPEQAAA